MLSPMCMRSLATIGYEIKKALADRKSNNNTKNNNNDDDDDDDVHGHWGPENWKIKVPR